MPIQKTTERLQKIPGSRGRKVETIILSRRGKR